MISLEPTSVPEALPGDFPDWLGPVLVKELRRGTRRGWFVTVFILAQVVMVDALVSDLDAGGILRSVLGDSINIFPREWQMDGQRGFWVSSSILLGLVVPAGGITVLRNEREDGNAELLLMAGLTRWRIVLGAWLGLSLQAFLLLLSFLPYLLARYFLKGGTEVPLAMVLLVLLVVGSLTANAVAVGLSGYRSLLKRLIVAGLALPALFLTWIIALVSVGYTVHLLKLDSLFNHPDSIPGIVTYVGVPAFAVCAFTVSAFLQLGRAKLRLYDPRNWEPRPSRACLIGVILSPLIFGFLGICTAGLGTIPALVFGAFIYFRADRRPENEGLPVDGGYL